MQKQPQNVYKATFLWYLYIMENGEIDYKKLYEEALLTISEKEENLLRKEEIISDQQFELDKLRRHLLDLRVRNA